MTQTVVVLGDLVVDEIVSIPGFPIHAGQHQHVNEVQFTPGGAANTLIVGARLGLAMQAVGAVGDDAAADLLVGGLQQENVDVRLISRESGQTTTLVLTLVEPSGQHVFFGHHGTRGPDRLPAAWKNAITQAAILFFDGWTYRSSNPSLYLEALRAARSAKTAVFFDPGPEYPHFAPEWTREVLSQTTVLLATEEELRGMEQSPNGDLIALARSVLARGIQVIVVKRGEQGCLIVTASDAVTHPGFEVQVRDTAGAGDTLAAAVMSAYLKGWSLSDTAALANAAGAAAVERLGSGHQLPNGDAIFGLLHNGTVKAL